MKRIYGLLLTLLLVMLLATGLADEFNNPALGIRMEVDAGTGLIFDVQYAGSYENGFGGLRCFYEDEAAVEKLVQDVQSGLITPEEADAKYSEMYAPVAMGYVMTEHVAATLESKPVIEVLQELYAGCTIRTYSAGDYVCYIVDLSRLEDTAEARAKLGDGYLQGYGAFMAGLENMTFSVPQKTMARFSTMNLNGEPVNESIFASKKITVINVWATWCNPCLREMPELAAWAKEMPSEADIYFLCYDMNGSDSRIVDTAKQIAQKTGMEPTHILYWDDNEFPFVNEVLTAFPTTIFFDSEGNMLENTIVGANPEGYKAVVKQYLGE